jgi:O-antigen/teichoic acid export membrane protein
MRSGTPEADPSVLSGPDIADRVVRGGAVRAIGFGVVNLLGVLSSVVLLRHLGVSDFGRYGTVIALVAIASGLADAGLNMTGSRELALLPRGPQRRRLLGALLGVRLLLLFVAGLAALAFAVVAGYDSAMVAGTALAAAGAALVGAQSTLTLPLVVELRNGLVTLSEILKQVILVAGVVALAAAGAALTPFFAVQVLVGVGALLAVPFLVRRTELARPSLSRDDLRHLAIIALPVALASIVTAST